MQWREVSAQEFEQIPGKAASQPNRWDEVLDAIDQGKIIEIPATSENSIRGMRVGIGRRAKNRGIALEMRSNGEALAIRKMNDAAATLSTEAGQGGAEGTDETEPPTKTRRGRKTS